MYIILKLFQGLRQLQERGAVALRSRDEEAYLADASDVYDLERRMRAIDDCDRSPMNAIAVGLYPR